MAAPRVGNRLRREGRANPGRRHLVGSDVTAKMQRQYEDILGSLRDEGRYGSDRKRKQVAAATVQKLRKNPSALRSLLRNLGIATDEETRSELLAKEFHGRPVRDFIDVEETELYHEYGAVLGNLIELGIYADDCDVDEDEYIPIGFPEGEDEDVLVMSNPAGTNIEFIGGDQDIDWWNVEGASSHDKDLVMVGPVRHIAYYTDKHHLTGPKNQMLGTPYEHEFGEGTGDLPYLVFDRLNKKLLLAGGSYTITPEGIAG